MTESLPCAVCGHSVPLDMDYVTVLATTKRIRDRDEQDDYVLHEECARSALEGWSTP